MHSLYLVDASIYIFRAWFSLPDRFFDQEGRSVNALYGYTHFLLDLMLKEKPVYLSAAFDESLASCFRNAIYPEYKANRELPDENLVYQLKQCRQVTGLLGLHHMAHARYEADDIIGSLKKKLGRRRQVIIVTRDKDLGQLVGRNDLLWDFASGEFLASDDIARKMGVAPRQVPDYLALAGDSVDNIPGLPGIGAKKAVELLQIAGSVSQLLREPQCILDSGIRGASRVYDCIVTHADELRMYRQITEIHCDMKLATSLKDLKPRRPVRKKILNFFEEMGLGQGHRNKLDRLESR